MARLLLIKDGPALLSKQVRRAFPAPLHRVDVAHTGSQGLESVRADPPEIVLLDLHLPDRSGMEVYRAIRRFDARIPVIFITEATTPDAAIEAMKEGAFDYLVKPFDVPQLQQVMGEALRVAQLMRKHVVVIAVAAPSPDTDETIVGGGPAMREVYKAIGRVADQEVPVLVIGESGTGKELVARAIHQHGPRAKASFLAINCAAIPESLLESELFGHEKGAFTGADQRHVGKFEQCSGGTIFLDEIGDMPPALQPKVLRLLQEQAFERVGGSETIKTDVRLIAATHRDLEAWSTEGRFRSDLYYRLGVFTIHLPPLRERGADLALLVQHYVRRFSRELRREVTEVAADAMEALSGYSWPGNIRELQSVLKQGLLQASGPVLLRAFLPDLKVHAAGRSHELAAPEPAGADVFVIRRLLGTDARNLYAEAHRELDRQLLRRVMEFAGGSLHLAARMLGIARQTLRDKLSKQALNSKQSETGEQGPQ